MFTQLQLAKNNNLITCYEYTSSELIIEFTTETEYSTMQKLKKHLSAEYGLSSMMLHDRRALKVWNYLIAANITLDWREFETATTNTQHPVVGIDLPDLK